MQPTPHANVAFRGPRPPPYSAFRLLFRCVVPAVWSACVFLATAALIGGPEQRLAVQGTVWMYGATSKAVHLASSSRRVKRHPRVHLRVYPAHRLRPTERPTVAGVIASAPVLSSVAATDDPQLPLDPAPSTQLAISNVEVQTTNSTAEVTWQTNLEASAQGAYGEGASATPAVWTPTEDPSAGHETTFTGLAPSAHYTLWLQATDDWGRTSTAQLQVTTAPPGQSTSAAPTTDDGTIRVDGEQFFPRALWATCPADVPKRILDGINLFMGGACGSDNRLLAKLREDTFYVASPSSGVADAPGVIGWLYPDELDARLPVTDPTSVLPQVAVDPPNGLLSFLNLTNHFYSGAAPLPQGRSMYPELAALANVLSFDLYPLQNWCRFDRFAAVYDAQRELETLAQGKPTFQWIEVRRMDCPGGILDPTPETVRAETWLAIAGGADGIGYFPNNWNAAVGAEIRDLNGTIAELAPSLLGADAQADSNQDPVKVGARTLNGALYVIAVNSSSSATITASMHADGLAGRTVDVLGENRQLTTSASGAFTDSFDPLAVHIYVAAPPGWTTPPTFR